MLYINVELFNWILSKLRDHVVSMSPPDPFVFVYITVEIERLSHFARLYTYLRPGLECILSRAKQNDDSHLQSHKHSLCLTAESRVGTVFI